MLAKFLSICGPIFFTALKLLAISMRSSSLSSGLESSLLLAKLTFWKFGGVHHPVGQFAHTYPSQSHSYNWKRQFSSVCWWVTSTCLSDYFFICIKICCYIFLFTLSHISRFLCWQYWLLLSDYYHHPIHWHCPRGASGVSTNCSRSCGFCFVWVNANCSYPSTALSFIIR